VHGAGEDLAEVTAHADDAARHGGSAICDRSGREPHGPQERSAERGKTLADSPSCSK
jgi:hypothetical protein